MEKKNRTYYIQNIFCIMTFLAVIINCLEPNVQWSTATSFGISDKLIFFSKWFLILMAYCMTAGIWKKREVNWKNMSKILTAASVFFLISQLVLYIPEHFLCKNVGKFSFVHSFTYNAIPAIFIGGSLVIWGYVHVKKRIGIPLTLVCLMLIGILIGLLREINYSKVVCQVLIGAPIIVIIYEWEAITKRNYKKLAVAGLLSYVLFINFFTAQLVPFMGKLIYADTSYHSSSSLLTGVLGRVVWYVISIILIAIILRIIPENKIPFVSAIGEGAYGVYLLQGLICTIFIRYFKGYYHLLILKFGNLGLLVFACLLFFLCANPLLIKLFSKMKRDLFIFINKWMLLEQWELKFGEKNQMTKKQKIGISVLSIFFFVFTFFLFGPYELFIGGMEDIEFQFSSFFWPMLLIGMVIFMILFSTVCFLKGRISDFAISLIFGLALDGYLQGNFMNLNLGNLGGEIIEWNKYYGEAFWNLVVWLVIVGCVFLLYYMNKTAWRRMICIISGLLIVMQSAGLISLVLTRNLTNDNKTYFSTKEEFEMAKDRNIIVFVLDACDNDVIDSIMINDKSFFEKLDGFTRYDNVVSRYLRTYTSLPYILTDMPYTYDNTREEYFKEAWNSNSSIKKLSELGYKLQIFASMNGASGDGKNMEGLVSNVSEEERQVPYLDLCKIMMKLLAYRDMPQVLKPYFWLYTEDINSVWNDGYTTEDLKFYKNLTNEKLTIGEEEKEFFYYHLNGSHGPYILNEGIERVTDGTATCEEQTKACMNMLYEYMNQMKELGIYENSTIIITADHGFGAEKNALEEVVTPVFMVKLPGNKGKLKISHAPVINTDFWPTVLGDDYEGGKYGEMSLDKVYENMQRKREVFMRDSDDIIYTFDIGEDARNHEDWNLINQEKKESLE